MAREEEIYLGFCERWRNIPKPTIAAVQGRCISGGLMLCWPMDLIVASDDAQFSDVVVAMGIIGVEYFAHPWEVGVRKAKEMLFTGKPISAEEARMLGMVNQVVPRAELAERTLELAKLIATKPTFAVKSVKQAVNAAEDAQGRHVAFQTAFAIHHLTTRTRWKCSACRSTRPATTNPRRSTTRKAKSRSAAQSRDDLCKASCRARGRDPGRFTRNSRILRAGGAAARCRAGRRGGD